VVGIDLLTNSIDTNRFSWTSAITRTWQNTAWMDRGKPVCLQVLVPLLVHGLSRATGINVGAGFMLIAYLGAFTQLLGVFLLTRWYTKSIRGAWLANGCHGISLFNVKFLIFDPFSPTTWLIR